MTLSPRAIRALGASLAMMVAEHSDLSRKAFSTSMPVSLQDELREVSRQTGQSVSRIMAVACYRLMGDLRVMQEPAALQSLHSLPPKPADPRGEIARRLGVGS